MTEMKAPGRTRGRLIGGVLLGLVLGALSPYMLAFASLLFLAPVLTARLYAFAGVWPAVVSCLAQIGAAYAFFGPALAAIVLLLLVAPLMATLWLVQGGRSLADVLRLSIPIWMLCAALSVAVAHWAAGTNLADYIANLLRGQIESMPSGMQDVFLSLIYGGETPAALNFLTYNLGFMDPTERARGIASLTEMVRNTLALYMTGMLLSSAALTALLCAAWPMRCLDREGRREKGRWMPLSGWHLPGSLAVCAAVSFVAALIVSALSPVSQAQSVCVAVQMLAALAFRVQAVGSLERRLGTMGVRPGMRAFLIVVLLLVAPMSELTVYYGMVSALFGPTHGVVTRYLERRRKERGDGDEFPDDHDDGSDGNDGEGN